MKQFLPFTALLKNTKTEVIFGIFGEMFIAVIALILLGLIVFIFRKMKIRSIKTKFKRDYGVSLPSDTKLDYRRNGSIKCDYGNRLDYFVFKFKKEPTSVIENFVSVHLKEDNTADELKEELKKYFDTVINSFCLVYDDITQQYLPNWDNKMIWNNGTFPAIYYPDSMEMIVCITTEE